MPEYLAAAVNERVDGLDTSAGEIAELMGRPVGKVCKYR
ncbi:DNA-directed RNA polymerase specialized sigma24 family protein [Allocatelliglobosispora scoriae]|uniref:DNA-directed RNA polymerase specialized sigma24 family protein n=1 Tax=Allocatelliglobosispora scoriae TaxID=643052 RepID=A0A841BLQ0_9ACTN|nr:DNA-directed RNA polymerase specialized sigma24 family protein [Allocatelliglobosispora scoriae]